MSKRHSELRIHRRGATLVLAALFIPLTLGMIALAVDIGYMVLVRTQLQVAADSAAMATAMAKLEGSDEGLVAMAEQYAGLHAAGGKNVQLNPADVEFGTWDRNYRIFTLSGSMGNAVRVIARRDETTNGRVPLFFARVLGFGDRALQAEATAAFLDNFSGFRPPRAGENLAILPITLDDDDYASLLAGIGADNWSWNAELERVTPGPDGFPEANLFPRDTDAPGNRGTVNIGTNDSTAELSRQILQGASPEDLAPFGGKLALDENGVLELSGNTGVSSSIQDALAAITGQTRIVMVCSQVTGTGSKAQFAITRFMGVRIMEVEMSGGLTHKRVMIQPATMVVRGGIPASGTTKTSEYVFSPAYLAR